MNTYIENQTDIIHETSVDFVLRPCSKEIHIVQYDKSLPIIKVELFKNGERFSLPEEAIVNIRFGKLDRTFVYKSILGTNVERNIVYFEVDEQMAIIPGRIWPVLEVIYSNGKTANSSPIHFIIERNPIQDDYIESEEYFPIIYELQGSVASHEIRISNLESLFGSNTNQFNGFVGGSQVHEQIQNGQIKYCQSGTQSTIDPSQSPIINIELTQEHISAVSNKKAMYIKKIHIEYELDSEIGVNKTWEYEFTSRIFGSGSTSDDINPKVVSLSDITTGLELEWTLIYRPATGKQYYGSYTSTKGQQFGSNTNPSDYISLHTTSIQNATIKNVWIEVSGNSGTTAKIKLTLVQDHWTVNDIVDPNITANNEQYIFYHEGGTHLGSGSGEIIEYNHVFLRKENDIVTSISAKSEYLYIEEDSSKESDTYRLYKYVDDQMQEVSKTRLGTTSDTAYRGDYGQDNYNKLKEVREQHFEFVGEKEFHDPVTFWGEDVAVTINGTLYVNIIGDIESGPLLAYDGEGQVWDMYSIRYINVGTNGADIRFLQSEYLDPLTGEITVGDEGGYVNQVRLLNIADPINNTDAANKQYVDNKINDIENLTTNKSIMLSSKKKSINNIVSHDDVELSLKINLINFNDSDVGKCIYLYRKAKQRIGGLRKCYKHPKDLYISYEPSERYLGYTYMGYKMNAGHRMPQSDVGHTLTVYTPVPTFMPREGTIQTEWILTQEDITRGYIEIDICSEWVSLISHHDIYGVWTDLDSEKWTRVVGCRGDGNCINIKFGLVNESGIMECISNESVKFGIPVPYPYDDSRVKDILYIDDVNETAFIIPNNVYFEIK